MRVWAIFCPSWRGKGQAEDPRGQWGPSSCPYSWGPQYRGMRGKSTDAPSLESTMSKKAPLL